MKYKSQCRFYPPSSKEEFLSHTRNYDFQFLNLVFTDLNGVRREKLLPADSAERLLQDGEGCAIPVLSFGLDSSLIMIQDHVDRKFGNFVLRPVVNTLRLWSYGACEIECGQVLCTAHWSDGQPIEPDSRAMAVRQLDRLKERGLDMLMATEVEFELFKLESKDADEPVPSDNSHHMLLPRQNRQYLKFYSEMDRRMRALDFKSEAFHTETGVGHLEMPLEAQWGILAADNLLRFKMIADEVAQESGFFCSFMTKPLCGGTDNAFHLNHSVWRREDEETPTENVMFDEKDPKKLSAFARHWMAGILHHSNALTALTSPTVNCYHRLHARFHPHFIDWAIDDRFASIRVKSNGTPQGTYLESRAPSSASNPYLVLAGTIAAGLDGVDRKLELPDENSKELGTLPKDLPEALEALLKDEALTKQLGAQFIDWFVTMKKKEAEEFKSVSIPDGTPEDFKKERAWYFDTV